MIQNFHNNFDKVTADIYEQHRGSVEFLRRNKIKLSTITLTSKLNTNVKAYEIARYAKFRHNELLGVNFGKEDDPLTNRCIVNIKKKKKPKKKNFDNQVSVMMQPQNNMERNPLNIKIFINGSLQITGCKDMEDFFNTGNTLIDVLKRGITIQEDGKERHIEFIDNYETIGLYQTQIHMINCDFKLPYKINREKLYSLLKKNHKLNTKDVDIGYVDVSYEPAVGHSSVDIKYNYRDEIHPSIFIFQTGSIIITGWKAYPQLIEAFGFVNRILDRYYDQIRIMEIDQKDIKDAINMYFNEVAMEDVDYDMDMDYDEEEECEMEI